jgi:hypothetical protein
MNQHDLEHTAACGRMLLAIGVFIALWAALLGLVVWLAL